MEGKAVYNDLRKVKEIKDVIPQTLNPKPEDYLENYIDTNDLDYRNTIKA